jgi:YNFM family putative membrane transporter
MSAIDQLPPCTASAQLQFGTPAYRRTARAMFIGGFTTFSMLYCVQPLLPVFSHEFQLSPAMASGAVAAATSTMALMLIPASLLADRFGRRPVMNASLGLSSLFLLASSLCSAFWQLLLLRALLGLSLAGLPAVAMAYLSEEIEPRSLGRSLGLYIAGNALGGMCGRLFAATLSDWLSWRYSLGLLGVLGGLAAFEFWRCLPPSRHYQPRHTSLPQLLASLGQVFKDAGMPWLFLCAFLLMGAFVSLYNVLGFRLEQPPFSLRPSQEGLIFVLYMVGTFGSAWAGKLADRVGRRNVLWIMVSVMASGLVLTLTSSLAPMVLGIAVFTFGFFGGHAVASSWIGLRSGSNKALGSALYLGFYYLGSSVIGAFSGWIWSVAHWPGLVALLLSVLLLCMAVAVYLRKLRPLVIQ